MMTQRSTGASLIEVLIVIGVFATAAVSAFVLLMNESRLLPASRIAIQAQALAEEGLEASRAIRDLNWTALATGTHGLVFTNATWGFQGASDTTDGVTRQITITEPVANERLVESTVHWTGARGESQSLTRATILANWRNTVAQRLFGNWQNPQTLGTLDLGPGNQGRSLVVRNGYVYLASSADSANKPDFFIIDATSGTNPAIRGRLNTGPGLVSIALNGAFAYVANADGTAQLQTINISNTSSPALINSFRLGNNTEEGTAVAVSGSIAYVATEKDSGPEFFVVNVSNPTAPSVLGTLEVSEMVNDIYLRETNAYLATASSTCELLIVDISTATNPTRSACVNLQGTNAALSVYVNDQDHRAYVARKVSGDVATPELAILDVTNPRAPILLGTLEFQADVRGIFAADALAFLGTAFSNQELNIYDVSTPAAPALMSGLNFPQVINDLAFENNIIYVAVRSNDALRIITSQ